MVLKTIRLSGLVCLVAVVLATMISTRAFSREQRRPAQAPPAVNAGDYAGSDTCIVCHADQGKHFQSTVMGKAFARPKNEKQKLGCEACHGPGKAHIEAGGGKDTIPVRFTKDSGNTVDEKNGACLSCHERGNRLFWQGSPHETRNIALRRCATSRGSQRSAMSRSSALNFRPTRGSMRR